jgi:hypothetical protein
LRDARAGERAFDRLTRGIALTPAALSVRDRDNFAGFMAYFGRAFDLRVAPLDLGLVNK